MSCVGLPKDGERPEASHSMISRSYSSRLTLVPCGPRRKSRPLSVTMAWPLCLCLRYFGTEFLSRGMCSYPLWLPKRNLPFWFRGKRRTADHRQVTQTLVSAGLRTSDADGTRTRNHRIDSPGL